MKNLKVLIVDDDPEDQEFLIEGLNAINATIECSWVKDGYAALNALEHAAAFPDYIFLDMNMARMNGKQCLQAIKSNPAFKHIPVVIFTTSSSEELKREMKLLGSFHFLTKPVRISALKNELELLFNKHGLNDAPSPIVT